jgi:hypothetical protein
MPTKEHALQSATALMATFAERTGLAGNLPQQRYLWTDAFAVCNFLGLARRTGDPGYTALALQLVDAVHHELGRHRADDPRVGWLSGLPEHEGGSHPTRGGLRIGKKLPERLPEQPFDERLEWDRDGQYFHYLTKWMHGLDQVSRATGDPRYNLWARELAAVAHTSFVDGIEGGRGPGRLRMNWKMSIDRSRPLVPYMGQHDPLDGLLTCIQLEATASLLSTRADGPSLEQAIADFATLVARSEIRTADPLGLGSLLVDAGRIAHLIGRSAFAGTELLERVLEAAGEGLSLYTVQEGLGLPASRRLAFRELGLALGLSAIERSAIELLEGGADQCRLTAPGTRDAPAQIQMLASQAPLGSKIVGFWLDPQHRKTATWLEHRDINDVMLATALVPDGFLPF